MLRRFLVILGIMVACCAVGAVGVVGVVLFVAGLFEVAYGIGGVPGALVAILLTLAFVAAAITLAERLERE